jgi:opacity protein-like surface antigen
MVVQESAAHAPARLSFSKSRSRFYIQKHIQNHMKQTIIVAAAAALFSFGAQAQSSNAPTSPPWYGELGYTSLKFHDGSGFSAKPSALRAIVGYNFHPNFALEGMLAGGVSNGSTNVSGVDVDVKLQSSYGIFAKPKVNFDNFEVFARLGWTRERVRESSAFGSATGSDDDFAWGAGASYNFSPKAYVTLDYLRYYSKDSAKIDGWTLGAGYRF